MQVHILADPSSERQADLCRASSSTPAMLRQLGKPCIGMIPNRRTVHCTRCATGMRCRTTGKQGKVGLSPQKASPVQTSQTCRAAMLLHSGDLGSFRCMKSAVAAPVPAADPDPGESAEERQPGFPSSCWIPRLCKIKQTNSHPGVLQLVVQLQRGHKGLLKFRSERSSMLVMARCDSIELVLRCVTI